MADTPGAVLPRTHPLADRTELTALTGGLVTPRPNLSSVLVRALPGGPAAAAAAQVLGAALPVRANTWVATERGKVVWLGPDEWLVLDDTTEPWVLEDRLRSVLAPLGGAATDVSAQRTCLRLHGPHAEEVLRAGCSLDVHPRVFGPGSAAQVNLARAGVVLLALAATGDDFEVLVRSSFAGYLAAWLIDTALEFGPHPS
ncbi:sarcosine oxidase subunit gamma [Kineococcus aurantiacus]|uniref:Sarcosine oxidase subunit gamma n=1 Tax=Kineococcus aurantiacus TaxID=37633 RepID=A0A7Y9DQC9_9ACTN|nr:sarcosine oxidase subunit gamma family protein [Kineococcus aurantiacus]NYD24844.1 sarcosine oxidase subunit gamma [Kineococcus aurantiacus]